MLAARTCAKTSRLRTLSARSRRVSGGRSVGDVADQVERIEVRIDLFGQRLKPEPFRFQLIDDRLLAIGSPSTA